MQFETNNKAKEVLVFYGIGCQEAPGSGAPLLFPGAFIGLGISRVGNITEFLVPVGPTGGDSVFITSF